MAIVERKRPSIDLQFVGGAYEHNSSIISAQEAINVFPEIGQDGATPFSMVGVPGATKFSTLDRRVRGMTVAFGSLYVAAGEYVYKMDSAGVATNMGVILNDRLPVSFSYNIFELLIVSGGVGYVAQKGAAVITEIADTDFPDASISAFLDGYGLLVEKNSGRLWFTGIDDFESVSGIDFVTVEGSPDNLVSMLVDHREVWLFGTDTTEVWFNTGDNTNPLQRIAGGFIERGCRGVYSPAKVDNSVFWLGNNGVVYRADGLTPIRISNHGIEQQIAKSTSSPIGMAYSMSGHEFYQLAFPGEFTCVYDVSTQVWHTRKNLNRPDSVVYYTALWGGRQYIGGDSTGVYYYNENVFTFDGEEIERIRSVGPIRLPGFVVMRSLIAVFETGSSSSYISESSVFLEVSDDGGKTFGSRYTASIGSSGQYTTEVKFHGLGGCYDGQRVIRLTMTDSARYALIGLKVI